MHRFWEIATLPLLDALEPASVIDVGCAGQGQAALLADYCGRTGAACHLVPAAPSPEIDRLALTNLARVHRADPAVILPQLGPMDVVVVDGKPSWAGVLETLRLSTATADSAPVLVCSGTAGRHARSDGPGDGGPRRGVLTAVEDFLADRPGRYQLVHLPVLDGLALLVPRARLEAEPRLRAFVDRWNDPAAWRELAEHVDALRRRELAAERPVPVPVEPALGRDFVIHLPASAIRNIEAGVFKTTYRGIEMQKNPFDLTLYLQLVGSLRPRTVIEIGSWHGASALWFADTLRAHGIDGRVISIDYEKSPSVEDPLVEFRRGDALALGQVLSDEELASLPRPLLVTEDSRHTIDTCLAVLEFFHPHLQAGEYIVIEDGALSSGRIPGYEVFADGPNRAVSRFLREHGSDYEIDTDLCDRYGRNVTFAPNGWLRRKGATAA